MLKQYTGLDREKYPDLFAAMFRQRKIVLHDQKGWKVDVVDGEFEMDQYDRDDTAYLMAFGDKGELLGSMRMISTSMPHMLTGPFRSMFPNVSFSTPTVWEGTRFVVHNDPHVQSNGVSRAACELMLGMTVFALDNGIKFGLGVYDASMARVYNRCGFQNKEISRHRTLHHGTVCVSLWEVSEELEASIIKATGLNDVSSIMHAA